MIDENATNLSYKVNGFTEYTNYYNQDIGHARQNGIDYATNRRESNASTSDKENKSQTNDSGISNGFHHSSPSRSQLGLNLRSATNSATKKPMNSLQVHNFTKNFQMNFNNVHSILNF